MHPICISIYLNDFPMSRFPENVGVLILSNQLLAQFSKPPSYLLAGSRVALVCCWNRMYRMWWASTRRILAATCTPDSQLPCGCM